MSNELNFNWQIYDHAGLVEVLVSVSDANEHIWPKDGWYDHLDQCPYKTEAYEELNKSRRRLEDHLRKNTVLLVKVLEIATKFGFPV